MNSKHYNDIINGTLRSKEIKEKENSLDIARCIFNNMGIALPGGSIKDVYETIKTENYMGWKKCNIREAREYVNNGKSVIGINADRVAVLAAENNENAVMIENQSVITLAENASLSQVEDLDFYAYSLRSGDPGPSNNADGNGGLYRQVNTAEPNCFGYALFLDKSPDMSPIRGNSHQTEDFSDIFEEAILQHYSCRRINSYTSSISRNEYRLAIRCPNNIDGSGIMYHVIYQLTSTEWAGKDNTSPSRLLGKGNPSTKSSFWENDKYAASAGTIYFAVVRH